MEKNYYTQDGVLLNFLGKHLREINPYIIKNYFMQQLNKANNNSDLILCSDARPQDLEFIKPHNFLIVKITADVELCAERRILRGDTSLGSSKHHTEIAVSKDMEADYSIENNGSLEDFKQSILKLIGDLYDSNR